MSPYVKSPNLLTLDQTKPNHFILSYVLYALWTILPWNFLREPSLIFSLK